jgi:copper(I)-binding protein
MKKILAAFFIGCGFWAGLTYAAHEVKLSNITLTDPYTRTTVPAQKMGGGFVSIRNNGASDKLISVSSPIAKEVQLHSMSMDGNVMRMREVNSIDIPANGEVRLQPGGLHIMFIGLSKQLKEGETVPVKLKFEKSGEVDVPFHVKDIRPAHGEPGHDHSKDHQ